VLIDTLERERRAFDAGRPRDRELERFAGPRFELAHPDASTAGTLGEHFGRALGFDVPERAHAEPPDLDPRHARRRDERNSLRDPSRDDHDTFCAPAGSAITT
jgi:hypothetical protein